MDQNFFVSRLTKATSPLLVLFLVAVVFPEQDLRDATAKWLYLHNSARGIEMGEDGVN